MEIEKVFRLRQSVRSFTDEQITEAETRELLAAAQSSPIAMGDFDTTHITVVQDPQKLGAIRKACMLKSSKTGEAVDPLYGAQTLILVSATDISEDHIEYCNAACIVENILLQATALGLGSVYIWGCLRKLRANKEALALLDLPEGYEVLSAVAVGHATSPLEERDLGERIAVTRI